MYRRPQLELLLKRLKEPRRFIQVLAGPRQVGKTTLAQQVMEKCGIKAFYSSADEPTVKSAVWIEQQWEAARFALKDKGRVLLILDEIQKISNWSEKVKYLWDEDTRYKRSLYVIILGSSPLLIQKGLTESLAGRFEMIPVSHWTFGEMQKAFVYSLEDYVFYGGYPGAASIREDYQRWSDYILNSLIETSVSRDILLLNRVDKPALLRQLFNLGCHYSGQILSYQKMLGQLQDAGNTTTLAHYMELLSQAGLLTGIQKIAGEKVRQRGSSPKLQVMNTGLQSSLLGQPIESVRSDGAIWGHLVESAVGAHLVNACFGTQMQVYYWRDKNKEVDFVLQKGKRLIAIEVKSVNKKMILPGMEAFGELYKPYRKLLVGGTGIPVEGFLKTPVAELFE